MLYQSVIAHHTRHIAICPSQGPPADPKVRGLGRLVPKVSEQPSCRPRSIGPNTEEQPRLRSHTRHGTDSSRIERVEKNHNVAIELI